MNRGRRGFRERGKEEKAPRINELIRVPQVRLVDQDGEQVGVVETAKAIEMSEEAGMDLVEVSPNSKPPVCRIMNYGKFRYEQSKKAKKGKRPSSQLKEIRMGPRISDHDYQFKVRHAENFLKHRHKVRIYVEFRGRQNMYRDQGREILRRAEEDLAEVGVAEAPIRDEGRNVVIIMAPK